MDIKNLFSGFPERADREIIDILLQTGQFTLERIVSSGQATPPGQWYDQDTAEWVILLQGDAGILFEGEDEARRLVPGDYLLIPAKCRHRVEWTAPGKPTIWLAVHFRNNRM